MAEPKYHGVEPIEQHFPASGYQCSACLQGVHCFDPARCDCCSRKPEVVRIDHGGWISGPCIDHRARERYDREVTRTRETADKIIRDARESRDAGIIDAAAQGRILNASIEYYDSTVALLRNIYGVTD